MFENLKHFFVPHAGNEHKPGYFSGTSVTLVILFLSLSFTLYLVDLKLVLSKNSFLAAILPTVLVYETNLERSKNNLSMVEMDNELNLAAQYKADDMAAKSYFAHVSPDGKTPWYWLDLSGYQYVYAGENLAANFDESTDVVNAWIASPTHHANLIKPQYTKMGIGIARGKLNGADTTFVVQLFTTPKTSPASALARAVTPSVVAEASEVTAPQAPQPKVVQTSAQQPVVKKVAPVQQQKQVTQAPVVKKPVVAKKVAEPVVVSTTKNIQGVPIVKDMQIKKHDDALLLASLEKSQAEERAIKDEHRKKLIALVTATPVAPSLIEQIISSPRHIMTLVLEAILILTMLLFVATSIAGMKVPHKEVVFGSLAISGFAALLLVIVTTKAPEILLPTDAQSASVIVGL
ncbi:MAG: CAP domain-containing protein [Minisyncoccia bacterium]